MTEKFGDRSAKSDAEVARRARVTPIDYADTVPESRRQWDEQVKVHGRMTNMKQTLARSPIALHALMTWYPLRDRVETFLGSRATTLFAHAISVATDCLICSTFFRRILKDAGENPDRLTLDAHEDLVVRLGRALVTDPHRIDDDLFTALYARYSPENLVDLIAFAGLMIATNVFNNALRVDLDDYLEPYRGFKVGPKA